MPNCRDLHDTLVVIDQVQHAVVASARRTSGGERSIERFANPVRLVKKRAGDEHVRSGGNLLGEEFGE
ncbi:MAG: hypothetical protein JWO62_597 [Acidimicrobiaceae bacterium]|nr:hypothetical protein [Acidimicrobiaceae bacterium]